MSDGRLPTMTIVGQAQTVTLEDVQAAYPCPAIQVQREFTEKKMRDAVSGAGKTVRVFRRYSYAEETLNVTIPYVLPADYTKLRTMIEANPPTVAVTYLHLSSASFDLVAMTPEPDDFIWADEPSYKVQLTLVRNTA